MEIFGKIGGTRFSTFRENRGYTFCDSATFGSKERFYALKIDNKDVTWYNK